VGGDYNKKRKKGDPPLSGVSTGKEFQIYFREGMREKRQGGGKFYCSEGGCLYITKVSQALHRQDNSLKNKKLSLKNRAP